jgi:hypothetical protein
MDIARPNRTEWTIAEIPFDLRQDPKDIVGRSALLLVVELPPEGSEAQNERIYIQCAFVKIQNLDPPIIDEDRTMRWGFVGDMNMAKIAGQFSFNPETNLAQVAFHDSPHDGLVA